MPTFYPLAIVPERFVWLIKSQSALLVPDGLPRVRMTGRLPPWWNFAVMGSERDRISAHRSVGVLPSWEEPRGAVVTEPVIQVTDLGIAYRLGRSQVSTLKEFAIRAVKRQVSYERLWAVGGCRSR